MNIEKLPVDSAKMAGILEDDCLIDRWVMERREVCPPGRVVLTITAYPGGAVAPGQE